MHKTRQFILLLALAMTASCTPDAKDPTPDGKDDTGPIDDTADTPPLSPSLTLEHEALTLSSSALKAIAIAPAWLTTDLRIALAALDLEDQETYAALLLDLENPLWLDEVAFGIAHTSPEILRAGNFHPQLFVDNAAAIYAHDLELDYVRLVEMDSKETGPSTTTAYRVEEDGVVEERTVPQDIYYWSIVHPRLEDEGPYYIDGFESCGSRTLECPTSPKEGMIWRDFLWTVQDKECPSGVVPCPVLREVLADQDLLWKSKTMTRSDNGAIGVITQWVLDVLDFGALSERSVQPNRIYGLHHGNCGEHADFTSAAARTALIPTRNVGAWGNDHTWNEFWDQDWVQWEPVNTYVGYYWYYADSNGDYYRSLDWLDNDCDGRADEGEDDLDHDGDGVSIADGDCDDTDANVLPSAVELENGIDDDCDGIADAGTDATDLDADGWTIADGDCDDNDAGRNPDAADPAISNNRVYAITTARGDAWLDQLTERYGTTFEALIHVTDRAGHPIEGATVTMYGPITVYPEYSDYWWFVTEATTDNEGLATFTLGEANRYAYRVDSPVGIWPASADSIHEMVAWSEPGVTLEDEVTIPTYLPTLAATKQDLRGDLPSEVSLSYEYAITSTRIRSQTMMLGDTFSLESASAGVDSFVVDQANYDLYVSGQPFGAMNLAIETAETKASLSLPLDRAWYLVLANTSATTSTRLGHLSVSAMTEDTTWSEQQEQPIELPPASYLAWKLQNDPL